MSIIMGLIVGICSYAMLKDSNTPWIRNNVIILSIACGLFWSFTIVLFIISCIIHGIKGLIRPSIVYIHKEEGE